MIVNNTCTSDWIINKILHAKKQTFLNVKILWNLDLQKVLIKK